VAQSSTDSCASINGAGPQPEIDMVTSDDRWTCPVCDRTFVLDASRPDASAGLAALQGSHAEEHAPERALQLAAPAQPSEKTRHRGARDSRLDNY